MRSRAHGSSRFLTRRGSDVSIAAPIGYPGGSAWVDNLGTAIDTMEGNCDAAARSISYVGKIDNPTGGGQSKLTWVLKIESKDRFVVEMLEPGHDGKEFASTEIVGTRAP